MFTDEIYAQVNKWEGNSITDDKVDLGGLTNSGITWTKYKAVCKPVFGKNPTIAHFKTLSTEEKKAIYKNIWNTCLCDQIQSNNIAVFVYDFAFNSGFARREIQEVLQNYGYKLTADNEFGNVTIGIINRAITEVGEEKLLDALFIARMTYLVGLVKAKPEQIKFMSGWLNRIYDLRKFLK